MATRIVRTDPPRVTAPRLITRYDNRKLYDAEERRYVTIEELARMIAAGTDVHVRDRKSGRDITTVVLAQVILEGVRDDRSSIPQQVLTRLIRLGSAPAAAWAEWVSPPEAAARARAEAERIAGGLIARGRRSLEERIAALEAFLAPAAPEQRKRTSTSTTTKKARTLKRRKK